MSKRNPFSNYIAQGCSVKVLHSIGKAAIAHVWCQDNDLFAARHRHHQGSGPTPQAAIKAVRKARKVWQANEDESLTFDMLINVFGTPAKAFHFMHTNNTDGPPFTRAELRREVTRADRKAYNWATYRKELADLGILLSKPKQPQN